MSGWQEMAAALENEHVRQARAKGQKLVGYACLATPRELFDAAGLYPYRLRGLGRAETEQADARLSRFNCGFCRSCLQLGLEGAYDFLDGLVETNGCDHLRGMFENWQYARPQPFFHYLRVPHLTDADALDWFAEELQLLREALRDHFGAPLDDAALAEAAARREQVNFKLKQIYRGRWEEGLKITGSEFLSLAVLEGSLPPDAFSALLDRVLGELSERPPLPYRARLFMGGAATDEVALIAGLESLGGLVVADSFCFSGRVLRDAPPEGPPLRRLAEDYLQNLLCPRMFEQYPRRLAAICSLLDRSRADGAVFFHNKFCDLHGIENVKLRQDLEKAGMPVLLLEKEYGAGADLGRLKTRVQAFLERIGR